jgi:ABC-type phosphonate transport system ATPase subunit
MTVYAVEELGVAIAGRAIVHDVSFEIGAGECVALVGASGSGKSQTCLAPFGLSPGIATGSARLADKDLVGLAEPALRRIRARDAGFVFQQPLTALSGSAASSPRRGRRPARPALPAPTSPPRSSASGSSGPMNGSTSSPTAFPAASASG